MPINFFENPTIKLSVPEHLNDPFEYNTSENIKQLKATFWDLGNERRAETLSQQYLAQYYINITKESTLTETPRNFLMWAQYAAQ